MSPVFFLESVFLISGKQRKFIEFYFSKKMHFKAFFERTMTIEVYNNTLLTENSDLQKKKIIEKFSDFRPFSGQRFPDFRQARAEIHDISISEKLAVFGVFLILNDCRSL